MKAYNFRHKLKTFVLLLMYYDSHYYTKYANFIYEIVLFSNINENSTDLFNSSFFLNVKCVESASKREITDVMSFQLRVEIVIKYIKYILIHFYY